MSSINIGVLISGGGTNLQALIDSIKEKHINAKIQLVISNKRDAYGLKRAENNNIEAIYINKKDYKDESDYNKKLIEEFKSRNIELIVLAGYLRVLSSEFIKEFEMRIINIHPSLIPSFSGKGYYGELVHKAVLDRGVKVTGATVHFVDEGTDTGPIIMQRCIDIDENETIETLQSKVLEVEHEILIEAVRLYCNDMIKVQAGKVNIRKV